MSALNVLSLFDHQVEIVRITKSEKSEATDQDCISAIQQWLVTAK